MLNVRATERRRFTVSLPSRAMVSVLVHDCGKGLRNGEYGKKDGDRVRKVEQAQEF
jgi:hypothetical protein